MELFKAFGTLVLEGMDTVNSGLKKFEDQGRALADRVGEMGKSVSAVGDRLSILTGAATVAAGGILALTNSTANYAAEVQRMSKLSNTTTEDFQKAAYAAKTVGIEQDKLSDIYKDMNDRVGDFLSTGAGPMADFFENIGPKVGVTAENFRNLSGPDALQLYVSSLEKAGVGQQEMTFYLEAMASDVTALLPLLANGGAEMERLGERAAATGAIMSDEAIAAAAQYRAEMGELRTQLASVANEIGIALMPLMQTLIRLITEYGVPAAQALSGAVVFLVDGFMALPAPLQSAIALFSGFVLAIGPVLSITGRLLQAFALLRGAAVALGAAKGALALAAGALSAPLLAVIGILAAVGAAVYAAIKYWDEIKGAISAAAGVAVNAWSSAAGLFSSIFSGISDVSSKAADVIAKTWSGAASTLSGIFSGIVSGAKSLGSSVLDAVSGVARSIGGMLSDALSAARSFAQQLPSLFSSAASAVASIFRNLASGVVSSISGMANSVINRINSMVDRALSAMRKLYKQAVGNSIIPDLARDVVKEMGGMADDSIHETDRMRSGVEKALPSGTAGMSGSGGIAGGVTVDMRHAVIRDDRDMLQRMYRKGVGLTGAFA